VGFRPTESVSHVPVEEDRRGQMKRNDCLCDMDFFKGTKTLSRGLEDPQQHMLKKKSVCD
jgi:hypothetical protein